MSMNSLSQPLGNRLDEAAPPCVLLIDDDPAFSDLVKRRLEQHGVAVVRAFDGLDGYRRAFAYTTGAIILDIEMPESRGDVLLQRLKEKKLTSDVPVIVVSGNTDPALRAHLFELGAVEYLTKPVDLNELVRVLARHVEMLPHPSSVLTS